MLEENFKYPGLVILFASNFYQVDEERLISCGIATTREINVLFKLTASVNGYIFSKISIFFLSIFLNSDSVEIGPVIAMVKYFYCTKSDSTWKAGNHSEFRRHLYLVHFNLAQRILTNLSEFHILNNSLSISRPNGDLIVDDKVPSGLIFVIKYKHGAPS